MGWITGAALGAAAGAGINRVLEQSRMRQALDPRLFSAVDPPLPVERWSVCEGLFAVGLPGGWRDLTNDELVQLATLVNGRVVFGIAVTTPDPRLGCSATSFSVVDSGPGSVPLGSEGALFVDVDALARARTEALPNFTSYGAPSRIALGGERAVVHHMHGVVPGEGYGVQGSIAGMQGELIVAHATSLYLGMFTSPSQTYESYLPHFWTMLGNWGWYSTVQ